MIKKLMVYILWFMTFNLFVSYYSVSTVYAADASPSPSADIQTKINELKKEIASKAATLKLEVNKKLQNKAVKGTITEINGNNLTISTLNNQRIIVTNEYTNFQDDTQSKKNLALKDLKKDDLVVGLGDMDDKNYLTAKKLIRLPSKKTYLPKAIWGQIVGVSNNFLTLKLRSAEKLVLKTTQNTTFRLGNEEALISDAKINMFTAGIKESSESANLRFVYVIPTGGQIKPENKASPSASIAPSPSPVKK